jgi:predicted  nucleic acid-binding Zn-ribbon protein
MRKSVLIIMSLAIVALLAGVVVLTLRYREQGVMYAETKDAEEAVRAQFESALQSIAEIQDSLTVIAPEESRLLRISSKREIGGQMTATQKEQMLNAISDLKSSIKNTKQRIRELETRLKDSQTKVAGLERILDNLKKSMAEREATILTLTARVDSLSMTVTGLREDVAQGQAIIAEQEGVIAEKQKEIGTIYYVIGTKKFLKDKGIITETGGVIGLGKTAQLSGAFTEGDFTAIDTDQVREVPIGGQQPQVLSGQSRSSYELIGAEGLAKLHILDAAEFRKVKYLVIMVK